MCLTENINSTSQKIYIKKETVSKVVITSF